MPADTPAVPAARPSVGRVVHYVAYGTPGGEFPAGVCRAAVITDVITAPGVSDAPGGPYVSLCVLNPTGLFFNQNLPNDEGTRAPGSWHWPERVGG